MASSFGEMNLISDELLGEDRNTIDSGNIIKFESGNPSFEKSSDVEKVVLVPRKRWPLQWHDDSEFGFWKANCCFLNRREKSLGRLIDDLPDVPFGLRPHTIGNEVFNDGYNNFVIGLFTQNCDKAAVVSAPCKGVGTKFAESGGFVEPHNVGAPDQ
jgi:hypothetical protein